jgi:hypothetical protein
MVLFHRYGECDEQVEFFVPGIFFEKIFIRPFRMHPPVKTQKRSTIANPFYQFPTQRCEEKI